MISSDHFQGIMSYLSDLYGWQLTEDSVRRFKDSLPTALTDDDWTRISNRFTGALDDNPNRLPRLGDLAAAAKQFRRQQANAAGALPPAQAPGHIDCEEYVRFLRLRGWLAMRRGRLGMTVRGASEQEIWADWAAYRDSPLTQEEIARAQRIAPADAIAATVGGSYGDF